VAQAGTALQAGASSAVALRAQEAACEIVHTRRRYMAQRREVYVAPGLASRAFDLKPWVAAVDGLRSTVGLGSIGPPSLHMRSFHDWQARLSASSICASPPSRSSAERSAKMPVITRTLAISFVSALRSPPEIGGMVILRGHGGSDRAASRNRPRYRVN
jgi:hypothetical protein